MKLIFLFVLVFTFNAYAHLGGKTADVEKDLPQLAKRQVTTQEDPAGCYTIKQIESDGIGVKEYINKNTDTVFMVRLNSRVMMSIKQLMKAEDFDEYKVANRAIKKTSRNHKNVTTETPRLKVAIDDQSMVHRSVMILKPHVPSCVDKPEALP